MMMNSRSDRCTPRSPEYPAPRARPPQRRAPERDVRSAPPATGCRSSSVWSGRYGDLVPLVSKGGRIEVWIARSCKRCRDPGEHRGLLWCPQPARRGVTSAARTHTGNMSEPSLDPDVYPPIDPGEPVPDDPGELLPGPPETLPPAPAEPGPGDPEDPDGVPKPV